MNDVCPRCSYVDLVTVVIHDIGPHKICQACGWRGPVPHDSNDDGTETDRGTATTPSENENENETEGERTEKSMTCDRCGETVPLSQTMIHGSIDDPESNEVVCEECIEPADRVI
jgi:DNA-directed RNA polymerase subunit M/transcription elongation factor TFIIS